MDFQLTEEQVTVRELARRRVRAARRPAALWRHRGQRGPLRPRPVARPRRCRRARPARARGARRRRAGLSEFAGGLRRAGPHACARSRCGRPSSAASCRWPATAPPSSRPSGCPGSPPARGPDRRRRRPGRARPYGARGPRAVRRRRPGGDGVTLSGTASASARRTSPTRSSSRPRRRRVASSSSSWRPTSPASRRTPLRAHRPRRRRRPAPRRRRPQRLAGGPDEDRVDWLLRQAWVGLAALQLGVSQESPYARPPTTCRSATSSVCRSPPSRPPPTRLPTATSTPRRWRSPSSTRCGGWRPAGPPRAAVHVAKWWAADAGDRVARTVQHLHGGVGADVTYPIHRYLLWSTQLANTARRPRAWHLQQLGATSARRTAVSGTADPHRGRWPSATRCPSCEIPLTRTAHRRGRPGHPRLRGRAPRPEPADERGTPDTYMSINHTNGLVGRYVTDWAGPAAR